MVGGFGSLLIVVGGFFLAPGWDLIGGSFHDRRWTVASDRRVMIAIGICLLAAARYRDRCAR